MLKALFDKLAVLSFDKMDNAKIHIFKDETKIGYIKAVSYDTDCDTDDFEFCTKDVKISQTSLDKVWILGNATPAAQRAPVDIVIEEDGKATGMFKNCWLERGDLTKGEWICEEFESMITFIDA